MILSSCLQNCLNLKSRLDLGPKDIADLVLAGGCIGTKAIAIKAADLVEVRRRFNEGLNLAHGCFQGSDRWDNRKVIEQHSKEYKHSPMWHVAGKAHGREHVRNG